VLLRVPEGKEYKKYINAKRTYLPASFVQPGWSLGVRRLKFTIHITDAETSTNEITRWATPDVEKYTISSSMRLNHFYLKACKRREKEHDKLRGMDFPYSELPICIEDIPQVFSHFTYRCPRRKSLFVICRAS